MIIDIYAQICYYIGMNKTLKTVMIIPVVLALVAIPAYPTSANQGTFDSAQPIPLSDPHTLVCRGLYTAGIACATSGISVGNYTPQPIQLNFDPFAPFATPVPATPSTISNKELTAIIKNAKAPRDLAGQKINIVSVPESPEIYMLVKGQKHPFPSLAVYYDYGYTLSMIQSITQDQLDKYPRAKLLKVQGDSRVYYLTEGGMVRPLPNNKKIYDIYGDDPKDVITISRKEFNFYPANEYVYQEAPLNRDIFQITENGKRYITPMAMIRLRVRPEQVAPVSRAELNLHKTLAPIID